MIQERALKESTLEDRELILNPRCGNCRRFPGNGQICEERGRPVQRRNNAKKYCYDPMTPSEFKTHKEDLAKKGKDYRLAHKEDLAKKGKDKKRRLKIAINALEKLIAKEETP